MPVTTRSQYLVDVRMQSEPKATKEISKIKVIKKKRLPSKSCLCVNVEKFKSPQFQSTIVSSKQNSSTTVSSTVKESETPHPTTTCSGVSRPVNTTNITTKKRTSKLRGVSVKKEENQNNIKVSNSLLDWRLPNVCLNAKLLAQRFDDYFSESESEDGEDRKNVSGFKKYFSEDKLLLGIHTDTSYIVFDDNALTSRSHAVTNTNRNDNSSSTCSDIDYMSHFVHREKIECSPLTAAQIAAKLAKYEDIE